MYVLPPLLVIATIARITTSRTATLTMMAAVGLRPKKPVRWASPVRGDAAPPESLSFSIRTEAPPLSLLALMSTSVLLDGAFGASEGGLEGVLTLGAAAGGGDGFELSCASASGAAPARTTRALRASAKVFITGPPLSGPRVAPRLRKGSNPGATECFRVTLTLGATYPEGDARRTSKERTMIASEHLPQQFNVATWFVDRNIAEGRARMPAFHCEGRTLTYGDVHDLENRTGNVLLELGVRMEDRVLVLCLDTPEFLGAFWGAIKIGAVPIPANTLLRAQDYAYFLDDSRATVAIVSAPLLAEAGP